MSQARFNIDKIREVNQLKIFSQQGKNTKRVFWAYLPNGFNINTQLETGGMFSGLIDTFTQNLGGVLRMGNIFGVTDWSGGIDIKRYVFYSGSQPIKFTINSFLILKEDYEKDILEPLQSLMDFYLPQRGDEIEDNILKVVNDSLEKSRGIWNKNSTGGGEFVSKIFNLLNKGYDAVRSFIGPVYTMHVPTQMSTEGGKQVTNTVFFGRHFYFEDCYITNVNLSIPPFLVEGGRPDIIDVQLTISTSRNATANMFKFNKVINTGDDTGWQWI